MAPKRIKRRVEDKSFVFKGWSKNPSWTSKLEIYNKILFNIENEIKLFSDILNEVRATYNDVIEDTSLQVSINSFPSFTMDLRQAAQFVCNYTYDSDEESCEDGLNNTMDDGSTGGGDLLSESCGNNTGLFGCVDKSNIKNYCKESSFNKEEIERIECKNTINITQSGKSTSTQKTNYADKQLIVLLSPLNMSNYKNNCGVHNKQILAVSSKISKNQNKPEIYKNVSPVKDIRLFGNGSEEISHNNDLKSIHVKSSTSNVKSIHVKSSTSNIELKELIKPYGSVEDEMNFIFRECENNEVISAGGEKNIYRPRKHIIEVKKQIQKDDKNNPSSFLVSSVQQSNDLNKSKNTKKFNPDHKYISRFDNEENKTEIVVDTFFDVMRKTADDSQIISSLKRNFICDYCQRAFLQKYTLKKHILICPMRADSIKYRKPRKEIIRKNKYECQLCQTTYISKATFTKHNEITHNLKRPYKCLVCRWAFFNERALQLHWSKRHRLPGPKEFKCPYCEDTFSRKPNLMYHFKKAHKSTRLYDCSICLKSFTDETALKAHEKSHGYTCDVCGFISQSESEMATHRSTHLQLITYKCDACSRTFNKKSSFTRHLQVHQRETVKLQ